MLLLLFPQAGVMGSHIITMNECLFFNVQRGMHFSAAEGMYFNISNNYYLGTLISVEGLFFCPVGKFVVQL